MLKMIKRIFNKNCKFKYECGYYNNEGYTCQSFFSDKDYCGIFRALELEKEREQIKQFYKPKE